MKIIKIISASVALAICTATTLFAQLNKANSYYDNLQFSKAIPYFKKALDKNNDPLVASKLG
ncbi:MAG: hypothetical protein ACE5DN_07910, partial [Flavobacteriales bacterium]